MKIKFSIFNFQFSISQGFTLIELLTVMGVLAVVGSITFTVLVTAIRTSTKATNITTVRQNGNSVITQMQRTIRYGYLDLTPPNDLECDGNPRTGTFTFAIRASDKITPYTYVCTSAGNTGTITLNASNLINTTDTNVTSCQMTCSQANSSVPPVVSIGFTIQAKNKVTADSIASLSFKTTVSMRNQE